MHYSRLLEILMYLEELVVLFLKTSNTVSSISRSCSYVNFPAPLNSIFHRWNTLQIFRDRQSQNPRSQDAFEQEVLRGRQLEDERRQSEKEERYINQFPVKGDPHIDPFDERPQVLQCYAFI